MVEKDPVDTYWDKMYPEEAEQIDTPEPEVVIPEPEIVPEAVIAEPEPIPEVVSEPVVETVVPEYKSNKKYIPIDNEEELYKQLNVKFGSKGLSDEAKALAYLREKNPHLDENDIQFLASEKYGIGVDDLDETTLTAEQLKSLREQGIDKKNLYAEARGYFEEKANGVQISTTDPFDEDANYKQFISDRQKAEETRKQQEQIYQQTLNSIQTAATSISEVNEQFKINIDDSQFAVDVSFKTNAEKQKQLTDFAGRYTPTDNEVKQFTDPQTGKFDYKGYLTYLSPMAYARDMMAVGIRQAIVKNREEFIEKELKNSSLRTNDQSVVADKKVDPNDAYWDKVYAAN